MERDWNLSFLNPTTNEEKQDAYNSALAKTVDAEIASGNFAGVVKVLSDAEAHGFSKEDLAPYREII